MFVNQPRLKGKARQPYKASGDHNLLIYFAKVSGYCLVARFLLLSMFLETLCLSKVLFCSILKNCAGLPQTCYMECSAAEILQALLDHSVQNHSFNTDFEKDSGFVNNCFSEMFHLPALPCAISLSLNKEEKTSQKIYLHDSVHSKFSLGFTK